MSKIARFRLVCEFDDESVYAVKLDASQQDGLHHAVADFIGDGGELVIHSYPFGNIGDMVPLSDVDKKAAYSLPVYISEKYASKVEFAEVQKVSKQQVSNWVRDKYIVVDDVLYSSRRKLNVR